MAKKLNDELKIETRNIHDYLQMMVTILIVDRRYTLTIDQKNDAKTSSFDAIGSAVYSTNKSLCIHTFLSSKVYGSKQIFTEG